MRASRKEFQSSAPTTEEKKKQEEEINIKKVPEYIENWNYTFNHLKLVCPDVIDEENYKELLTDLSQNFTTITKAVPLLPTKEELEKSREVTTNQNNFTLADDFFDYDFEWDDTPPTKEVNKK